MLCYARIKPKTPIALATKIGNAAIFRAYVVLKLTKIVLAEFWSKGSIWSDSVALCSGRVWNLGAKVKVKKNAAIHLEGNSN